MCGGILYLNDVGKQKTEFATGFINYVEELYSSCRTYCNPSRVC